MLPFAGEAERSRGRALFEAVVFQAREMVLARATGLRGVMGLGAAQGKPPRRARSPARLFAYRFAATGARAR